MRQGYAVKNRSEDKACGSFHSRCSSDEQRIFAKIEDKYLFCHNQYLIRLFIA